MVILPDIWEYIKHLRKLSRTIGGQIFEDIHELISKDVEHANKTKLTLIQQNHH